MHIFKYSVQDSSRASISGTDDAMPMIAMTFHGALGNHWRGVRVKGLATEDAARRATHPWLRVMDDGTLGDGRLVFEESVRDVFERHPSKHGISRNFRFVRKLDHTVDAHLVGGARVIDEG